MIPDLQLLENYAREKSQDAFTQIVQRHLDLVYTAALRQVRSPQLAEEISQSVFADLARAAEKLEPDTILIAWLYQVTRRTAIDVVRRESRRQARERLAVEMAAMNTATDWTHIEPLLDDAMEALDDTDRAAILLRYFENKSLREVGQSLGTSDDAAQKRVTRAVERLLEFFSKRGVTIAATGLVVLVSTNAVQSAPLALAAAISTAAILGGTATHTSTAIAATKVIAMTTLQKTLIGATIAVAVGTGIFEARKNSTLREDYRSLERQKNSLTAQLSQIQHDRDDAKAELASVSEENVRLKSGQNLAELLKLRGEIGVLRNQSATTDSNSAPANAMAKLMDSSTSKELSRVKIHELLKYRYAQLLQQLNLSPDDTEKFYGLIIDNELKMKASLAQLLNGNIDVDTALLARDAGKAELESQIAALLGTAGYAQYKFYNHTTDATLAVKRLNDQLGSLALSPDQSQRLQAVWATQDLNLNIDDMDLFRSKEALDEIYRTVVERAHQDLQQASNILSPQQMTAARTIQSNLLETVRTTINLSQQLVTTTVKQTGH